jgi:hypothetical protein
MFMMRQNFSDDTMHSNMLSGIRDSRFLKATKSIGIKTAHASNLLLHNAILGDVDVE